MSKLIKKGSVWMLSFAAVMLAAFMFIPVVYADTNGTELKITDQPDKLVLELGADWAGAEFELKLDSGVFPVPVVVDDTGSLTMDLGGSKTYTLKLMTPLRVAPPEEPDAPPEESSEPTAATPVPSPSGNEPAAPDANEPSSGIPPLHLALFIGGLIAAVTVLVVMYVLKKRRSYYDDDDYEYDDDEN